MWQELSSFENNLRL